MNDITPKKILPVIGIILVIIIFVISIRKFSEVKSLLETPTFTFTNTVPPTATYTPEPSPTPLPTNTSTPTPTFTPTPAYEVTVTALLLNARTGPAITFDIITELPLGTVLVVLGRSTDNEWLQVILPKEGTNAWVWIGGVSQDFDLDVLAVMNETITPTPIFTQTTTYGAAILAPPNLPGLAPTTFGNPSRRIIASISFGLLTFFMSFAWISIPSISRKTRKFSFTKLLQVITSLF